MGRLIWAIKGNLPPARKQKEYALKAHSICRSKRVCIYLFRLQCNHPIKKVYSKELYTEKYKLTAATQLNKHNKSHLFYRACTFTKIQKIDAFVVFNYVAITLYYKQSQISRVFRIFLPTAKINHNSTLHTQL